MCTVFEFSFLSQSIQFAEMIPDYNIKAFKSEWNDGKALCALCDAIEPGIFPNHAELDSSQKMENCEAGLECAFNEVRRCKSEMIFLKESI